FVSAPVLALILVALGDLLQIPKDIENHLDPSPKKPRAINPRDKMWHWIKNHPLADGKFAFFIFCLMPVQTLFAYNYLVLPQYVDRAMGAIGRHYMEFFVNAINPILIFVLTPTIAAMTRKRNVYNMMIAGTFVMALPAFLLGITPSIILLVLYIVIMSVGEAMWQPRFLQYAAEIAPKGRTGAYMGVAQFPWFLTKIVAGLYAGLFLMRYCPEHGPRHTTTMWLWFALIAITSTIMLVLAKGWIGKDFKTKAE
ncbi:MAG: MFS transporter, partial [Acidobacteriota bacterium]